jgi:hypothetical protein
MNVLRLKPMCIATRIILLLMFVCVTAFAADKKKPKPPTPPPSVPDPWLKVKFEAWCPYCRTDLEIKPISAFNTGGRVVSNGVMVTKTLTFQCPEAGCTNVFTQGSEELFEQVKKAKPVRPKPKVEASDLPAVPPPPSPIGVVLDYKPDGTFSVTKQGERLQMSPDLAVWSDAITDTNLQGNTVVGYDWKPDGRGFFR